MNDQAQSDTIGNLSDFIKASKRQLLACEYFAQTDAGQRMAADARDELTNVEADLNKLRERSLTLQEKLAQLEREVRSEISRESSGSRSTAPPGSSPPPQQQQQQPKGVVSKRTPPAVFDVAEKVMCYSCMKAIRPGAVAYRYEDGAIYCEACESRAKQLSASA